jgi:hypothetical protein
VTVPPPDVTDERRHPNTAESWWFDFAAADGSLGGYVRLAYRPGDGVAWYWAAVVGDDPPLVAFRAHDLRIPARGTEVRGDGVWSCLTCETPMEHWSVGLESFGVVLDDPLEGWRGERGERVPFGLDLEWEAEAPAEGRSQRYGQWCEVHGEVLIGDERLDVSCRGHREHAWGAEPPSGWRVAVAPLWVREGEADLETTWDVDGLPRSARLGPISLAPRRLSPVAVSGTPVVHALCEGPAWGWVSWWGPR